MLDTVESRISQTASGLLCPGHSFLRVQGKDMTGKDMTGSDRRGKDMTEGMTGMTGYNFSWGRV